MHDLGFGFVLDLYRIMIHLFPSWGLGCSKQGEGKEGGRSVGGSKKSLQEIMSRRALLSCPLDQRRPKRTLSQSQGEVFLLFVSRGPFRVREVTFKNVMLSPLLVITDIGSRYL